jgi:hypothetical protein
MSDTAGRSRVAATRGRIDFAAEEWAEKKCVYLLELEDRMDLKSGVSVSGRGGLYSAEEECNMASSPCSLDCYVVGNICKEDN